MVLEQLIAQTLTGLGYELVDFERAGNGLLRVFIDEVNHSREVNIDDCEAASRQLSYVFEVENINYERLEVSSPGIDRPLKKTADFARFVGSLASVKLKLPLKLSPTDEVGRKNFSGTIAGVDETAPADAQIHLQFDHDGEQQVLAFGMADVDKARLVPVYDFKGKGQRKE